MGKLSLDFLYESSLFRILLPLALGCNQDA